MAKRTMPAARAPGRPSTGHIKITLSLEPRQVTALRREAFRRIAGEVHGRPDVSAVLREIVDGWMRRGK